MSLFGSLFTGVSGMAAQSRSMAVISDNVANVSTVGYKGGVSNFASLVVSPSQQRAFSPGGVQQSTQFAITRQGQTQATGSATDAAIVGNGFFVVAENAGDTQRPLYTRAGSFDPDVDGYLRNANGFYLLGWQLDTDGQPIDVNTTQPVNVRNLNAVTVATSRLKLGANLDSGQAEHVGAYAAGDMATYHTTDGAGGVAPDFQRQIQIYDSLGNPRTVIAAFLRTPGAASWSVELYADPANLEAASHPGGLLASGTVSFNGNGGLASAAITPAFPAGAAAGDPVGIDWIDSSGATDSSLVLDLGAIGGTDGLTQFAGESAVSFVTKDGAGYGELNGVRIDAEGFVEASFSNGEVRRIYQIPIATFGNPNALDPRSGNVFSTTWASGSANLQAAGVGGAGQLSPAALESANVELADEFTKMIVTQRAYSANARVVTTTDDMLDELMRVKR
ncbi:flagellar hook protein FlgE [Geminicoccus roseus]|uniref:flagellar hook protein FlgE n=1 Tax=Geminicoccus roseus TaxID=404900 RepID=UPI00042958FC|nr:flagellar hook protein FlgE [Geminicoccus roseus]